MDIQNQPSQKSLPSQSVDVMPNYSPEKQKIIWKTDAFVVLALIIFWPVGLFLMWKYTPWRKWVKGLLTAFFLIGAIPLLVIWSLIFGIKGYSFVDNLLNPRVVNQSKIYNCMPVNSEWGKCTNTKYNFSFEYPATWSYIDLRPEGIGFGPTTKLTTDNFIISMGSPADWKTEDEAIKFAKGYFGLSSRQETTINGLFATKDYNAFTGSEIIAIAVIVDGKKTYQFMSIPDKLKENGLTLSKTELQTVFDHMASSFNKD